MCGIQYSCTYVIFEYTVTFNFIYTYVVPTPDVQITISENETFVDSDAFEQSGNETLGNETLGNETLRNLTIGDPLTLDCTVTAVRGISSSVDIIWATGGVEIRREDIMANIENDSAIYTDSLEISSLSAIDNGREYRCTVMINATRPVYRSDYFTLILNSE